MINTEVVSPRKRVLQLVAWEEGALGSWLLAFSSLLSWKREERNGLSSNTTHSCLSYQFLG